MDERSSDEEDEDLARRHETKDERISVDEVSGRSSKNSDLEDDSIFEPDLDYEPEDDDSYEAEEPKKEETNTFGDSFEDKFGSERLTRQYLSSDDDDIEVIDVINNEASTPTTKGGNLKEERKEHTKGRNFSGDIVKRKDEATVVTKEKNDGGRSRSKSFRGQSSSESNRRKDNSRDRYRPSSRSRNRGRDNEHAIKEHKYTTEDLEKVKAFFSENQSKRKESDQNRLSAKKFKGNDGNEWREARSRDDLTKEKFVREGRAFIQNYIPFPSSQKSNFKSDIKSAFKDELNEDILVTLTPKYCGLCFKDFDDDVKAWKHYTGTNHKTTIKRFNRGTYKGHPPFWRMVHERLCEKDKEALTEQEIFDQVCENYNVGENKEKVMYLVKKNIDCLMQYDQVGLSGKAYFVKNKNVQEVGKIFENYFYEKKRKEENEQKRSERFEVRGDQASTYRRNDETPSSRQRRSYEYEARSSSRSRGREDRIRVSRHSSSGYPSRQPNLPYGDNRSPASQMLVVDPSKLRMLPNGQIMIKPDDVMSMGQGEGV